VGGGGGGAGGDLLVQTPHVETQCERMYSLRHLPSSFCSWQYFVRLTSTHSPPRSGGADDSGRGDAAGSGRGGGGGGDGGSGDARRGGGGDQSVLDTSAAVGRVAASVSATSGAAGRDEMAVAWAGLGLAAPSSAASLSTSTMHAMIDATATKALLCDGGPVSASADAGKATLLPVSLVSSSESISVRR